VIRFHKGSFFILLGIGISIFGAEKASKMMKNIIKAIKKDEHIMKD